MNYELSVWDDPDYDEVEEVRSTYVPLNSLRYYYDEDYDGNGPF